MLTSHRLQIRHVELTSEINAPEMIQDKPETREKRRELEKAIKQNALELKEAIEQEDQEMEDHRAEYGNQPFGQTAETRELRSLAGKGSVDRIPPGGCPWMGNFRWT